MRQLALPVQLRDDATFSNFYIGSNTELYFSLQTHIKNKNNKIGVIYLSGPASCGRSHLLQACCHLAEQSQQSAVYFSLKDYQRLTPAILENLENFSLIAIDDIHSIAGNLIWEEAIFHLYNRIQISNNLLIVTAPSSPVLLNLQLKDLQSRLASGLIFKILPLNDEEKIAALKLRAKNRGLNLSTPIAKFLLHHYWRDMTALFTILEQLDQLSLAEKQKITIPWIKKNLSA